MTTRRDVLAASGAVAAFTPVAAMALPIPALRPESTIAALWRQRQGVYAQILAACGPRDLPEELLHEIEEIETALLEAVPTNLDDACLQARTMAAILEDLGDIDGEEMQRFADNLARLVAGRATS